MVQIPAIGNKVYLLIEGLEDMESRCAINRDRDAKYGSKGPGKGVDRALHYHSTMVSILTTS